MLTCEKLETRDVPAVAMVHPMYTIQPHDFFSGWTPKEQTGFYQLSQGLASRLNGYGQTVVIVDAFHNPNLQLNLNTYSAAYGLPQTSITFVDPNGVPGYDPIWGVEESLDVEEVHAIAPFANITVVESASAAVNDIFPTLAYARTLSNIVSFSAGLRESFMNHAYDYVFQNVNNQHALTFVSSGDDGGIFGVSYPADNPNVISVGGTEHDVFGKLEYAWSRSGGGPSKLYPGRNVPDVAWEAAHVNMIDLSYSQYFFSVGGTSIGAPAWAGLMARINQGRAVKGRSALLNASDIVFASRDFHDITLGNNFLYRAAKGYDLVTGRGSPNGNQLIKDLLKL